MRDEELDALIAGSQHHPNVEWRRIPGKGRGVFARRALPAGSTLEVAPMCLFPASDLKTDDHHRSTMLHHVFTWGAEPGREKALLCGFVPLYNHSATPNIELCDGPVPDTAAAVALRDIEAGEELCFDYGFTWFEVL
jgi:uncharacterized protein